MTSNFISISSINTIGWYCCFSLVGNVVGFIFINKVHASHKRSKVKQLYGIWQFNSIQISKFIPHCKIWWLYYTYALKFLFLLLVSNTRTQIVGKGKAIPVTGREGPEGCETSRLPHFLGNRLTDGGEVVSLTRRPAFTPRKIPGTHFC
jgi:hypothetical protein